MSEIEVRLVDRRGFSSEACPSCFVGVLVDDDREPSKGAVFATGFKNIDWGRVRLDEVEEVRGGATIADVEVGAILELLSELVKVDFRCLEGGRVMRDGVAGRGPAG